MDDLTRLVEIEEIKRLKGRYSRAVVAGGGGQFAGLGRAMARSFAAAGMRVAVLDLSADAAETAAEEIRGLGVEAIGLGADVRELDHMHQAADAVTSAFGACNILCA